MLALRAALAGGMMLAAIGGCRPDDTGAVLLRLEQQGDPPEMVSVIPPPATYSSSTAAVVFSADGLRVYFTATSDEGVLRLVLDAPLVTGATVALPPADERLRFEIGAAAWGNQGGTIFITSANPAIVQLVGVPMVARSGAAIGSFFFDGGGTFR
jgi:hypothetical protein